MAEQLTTQAVATWLGMKSHEGDTHLEAVVAATADLVDSLPDAPRLPADGPGNRAWAPRTLQAAVMLAARLYRRRNSPNGIEAMTDGGASYVSRYDSDISRMLRIDGYTRPAVG